MLEAVFLEGIFAGEETFKICFVCVFAHKSFFNIYSPQEHGLQQHSSMSIHGKLRQKEHGCSGSKLAEELRQIFVAE